MIEVERLTKDYGTVVAVRDVSFQVGKGEVCLLYTSGRCRRAI